MYLTASTSVREVTLTARTFERNEIIELSSLLIAAGIPYRTRRESTNRRGVIKQRFVFARFNSARLGSFCGVRFQGNSIQVNEQLAGENHLGPVATFRCAELCKNQAAGGGFVHITARSAGEALLKCGLIAKVRGWFGGVYSIEPSKR